MKSLVVFESMYGNTREIAEAVGAVSQRMCLGYTVVRRRVTPLRPDEYVALRRRSRASSIAMAMGAISAKAP